MLVTARDIVDRMRAVKSEAELNYIIQSCVWGNLAHQIMHNKLALGRYALTWRHVRPRTAAGPAPLRARRPAGGAALLG